MARHADFEFRTEGDLILLVDLDVGGPSVTNDAEHVVEFFARTLGIQGKRLLYRDTDGLWTELRHDGSRFAGFGFIDGDALMAAERVWERS